MILEAIGVGAEATTILGGASSLWHRSREKKACPLRFEYTYENPNMYLEIENTGDSVIESITVNRDYSVTTRSYFNNISFDDVSGKQFDLHPGESMRGVIGYSPDCYEYPRPPSSISIQVSYKQGRKSKTFTREVNLHL